MPKLTKRVVESITPNDRVRIVWDSEVRGFGVRVRPSGRRTYVLQYRTLAGRSGRINIGVHGNIAADQARTEARRLAGEVAGGGDPAADRRAGRKASREAPTLKTFAKEYLENHARAKKKPSSVRVDECNLRNHILPALGHRKVPAIGAADIARLHARMGSNFYVSQAAAAKPGTGKRKGAQRGAANRCLALLSKMMNLAAKWGIRPEGSNPCSHVDKYPERRFERFLSTDELARLGEVLARVEREGTEPAAVIAAIRLYLLTGCRRGEILTLRWEHVDLDHRCLRLADSKTGAKVIHLGPAAVEVLRAIERREDNPHVIVGSKRGHHFVGMGKAWGRIRERAGLADMRLHDLRHSYASVAVVSGLSLPMIGQLLGHRQSATTERYAHFAADPVKQAADAIDARLAAALDPEKAGQVVPLRGHPNTD